MAAPAYQISRNPPIDLKVKMVCDVTKITQQSNNPNNNPTIKHRQTDW
jgi:hypothetical protein